MLDASAIANASAADKIRRLNHRTRLLKCAQALIDLAGELGELPIRYTGYAIQSQSSAGAFYSLRHLATALQVSKKTVSRRAAAEHWPARVEGNHLEFSPPANVIVACSLSPNAEPIALPAGYVKFESLPQNSEARTRAIFREKAVLFFVDLLQNNPTELALAKTQAHFAEIEFHFSISSLRRWAAAYKRFGLDGVVEQKVGHSGRPKGSTAGD